MKQWKTHPSFWLVSFSVGIVLGITLAYFVSLKLDLPALILLVAVFVLVIWLSRKTYWPAVFCLILGLILAWGRASNLRQQIMTYDNLRGKQVVFSGELFDDVAKNSTGSSTYRLDNIRMFDHSLAGNILVTSRQKMSVKRGDTVNVKGVFGEGLAGYQAVVQNGEILSVEPNNQPGLVLRNFFTNNLDRHLNPLQSSLASAFLAGKRRDIPDDFNLKLQIVGLTHLVVASGFHLTVVVRAGKRLAEKHSRRLAFLLGLAAMILFSAMTGSSASMLRASFVSFLSLVGWYYGRKAEAWRILVLALAIVVLLEPTYLWGDVAFYLSFSSFAGVLLIGPILRQYFWGKPTLGFFSQLATEALGAQIATLPISLFFFGRLSLVAIVANLLAVPASAPIMLLSLLVSLLGAVPIIGSILTWLLQLLLNYIIAIVNFLSNLPMAQVSLEINLSGVVILYVLIIILTALAYWRNRRVDKAVATQPFNAIE